MCFKKEVDLGIMLRPHSRSLEKRLSVFCTGHNVVLALWSLKKEIICALRRRWNWALCCGLTPEV